MEVIEHLYSPRTFAAFIRSILEANGGGRFILTTPYHGYLKNLSIAPRRQSGPPLQRIVGGRPYQILVPAGRSPSCCGKPGSATWPSPARGASRTCGGTWCSAPKRRRPRKSGPATRLRNRENPAAVPAGGAVRRQMPPKQRGDGTEAAQGMVRKQHGDGRAAARR